MADIPVEHPWRNPWLDANVQAALDSGREPRDISMLCCQECGNWGYYNEGSHFECTACEQWSAAGERLDALIDEGAVTTLEDLIPDEQGEDKP